MADLSPENAILRHLNAQPCADFREFMAETGRVEDLPGLTERERSRVRILRAFQVAAIEVARREQEMGASGPELLTDIVDGFGIVTAGLLVQTFDRKGWRAVAKEFTATFSKGMQRYFKAEKGQ